MTARGNRRSAFALPGVDFSEANRLHSGPAKEGRQPNERAAPAVVRLWLEARLDRREPSVCKFLEPDVPILLALQPLSFRTEFPQPPLSNGEVRGIERTSDLLAVDLDAGVVNLVALSVKALCGLLKLLRLFRASDSCEEA